MLFFFLVVLVLKKDSVREIIREIPTISDVPKITKETKDELMGYLTT